MALESMHIDVDALETIAAEIVGDSPVIIRWANSGKQLGIYECYKSNEGLVITVFEL